MSWDAWKPEVAPYCEKRGAQCVERDEDFTRGAAIAGKHIEDGGRDHPPGPDARGDEMPSQSSVERKATFEHAAATRLRSVESARSTALYCR